MRHPFRTVLAVLALAALPALAQDSYRIDPVHSEISFKIRHLLAKVNGRFTKFSGDIKVDTKDIAKSSVEVNIDAASINTDNEARDKHLRSDAFFDVAKYPAITFKSTAVKEVSKGMLQVTGDFTMHGVTKRITIPVTSLGGMVSPFKDYRAGFEGSLKVNRQDFGVKWNKTLDTGNGALLGDDVDISLAIEAVKQVPGEKK